MPVNRSRRDLLKFAISAAVAPYFVPAAALAHGARRAPSDRLTMGFIGVGNMGGGHLGSFLGNPDVQIVAICDVDAEKRKTARERVEQHYAQEKESGTYAGCEEYNEFETLLARRDIDAVLIAVPDHWHALIAIAACHAGKDVYCEKPLSLTIREAQRMVAAARSSGAVFQTGSQQRSDRNFRFACEAVRNRRIGRLLRVEVGIGGPSTPRQFAEEPLRPGLDWDRWLGPAPWAPYNAERCSGNYSGGWRLVRDYSGGMTTDWGAHHIDIAQWGIGADGGGPVEITPPPETNGYGLAYRYENGVTLTRTASANGVLFVGTDGSVEVNRGYIRFTPEAIGRDPTGPGETRLYESDNHTQNWLDCIRTRQRPICDVEIGASSVTACHLGNIAYWLQRPLRWDPLRNEFIDDPSANRWLDRPYRAPWRIEA